MNSSNPIIDTWVHPLFELLNITSSLDAWNSRFKDEVEKLFTETQAYVTELCPDNQSLMQEAAKRAVFAFLSDNDAAIPFDSRIAASELLLNNQQPELALSIIQPLQQVMEPNLLILRGRALLQLGDTDQAKLWFETAAEREPGRAEPDFHLGFLFTLCRDYGQAETYYRKSLNKDPEHLGSMQNLACLYLQSGDYDAAIELARRIIGLNSKLPEAYFVLISSLNNNQDFDNAIKMAEQARLSVLADFSPLDQLEAYARFQLKQYDKAVKLLNRFLTARPDAHDMQVMRAQANGELGEWMALLEDVECLLEIEPYDVTCLDLKFRALFELKRWQEADIAFAQLVSAAPDFRNKYQNEHGSIRRELALFLG
ncbi:tetratricopeptide repeat protein [Photobacterium sagamiensis]|uniref:tetratricopeptide repeat protein n=1 Tax=Photobacterium sagamiensis TaxID=2910241 RepID=UPI003D1262EF